MEREWGENPLGDTVGVCTEVFMLVGESRSLGNREGRV